MPKGHLVTHSFENNDSNRCINIIQFSEQDFRFQEWRREPEDINGWYLILHSLTKSYPFAADAIAAAKQSIVWFKELDN